MNQDENLSRFLLLLPQYNYIFLHTPLERERKVLPDLGEIKKVSSFRNRDTKFAMMMMIQRRGGERQDSSAAAYNVVHKLPHGDSPYVRAKHVQVNLIYICVTLSKGIEFILIFTEILDLMFGSVGGERCRSSDRVVLDSD